MAKFTELPGKVQLGIVVLVLAIISGALYYFVYQEMVSKNTQLKATLKAKEDENNALRPYADKKADMERRIATLKDQGADWAHCRLIFADAKSPDQAFAVSEAIDAALLDRDVPRRQRSIDWTAPVFLVALLLVVALYLAAWPRRSASSPDVSDNDIPLAETTPPGQDERAMPPALYRGKRSLCI